MAESASESQRNDDLGVNRRSRPVMKKDFNLIGNVAIEVDAYCVDVTYPGVR